MQHNCYICKNPIETGPGNYKARVSRYCSKECLQKSKHIQATTSIDRVLLSLLRNAFYRASSKGIICSLTVADLKEMWEKQEGKCSLSGVPLQLGPSEVKHTPKKNGPSLDRIVPSKGYTIENSRLITYQVNCAKSAYTDEDLLGMCRNIIGQAA